MATDTVEQSKLFEAFEKPTYEQWKAAALETLKEPTKPGEPKKAPETPLEVLFEKKLCTTTIEGVTLQPIYNASDIANLKHLAEYPQQGQGVRGSKADGYGNAGWFVAQELPYGTPEAFNAALLEDLNHGQTALNILLDIATQRGLDADAAKAGEVGACGLSLCSVEDLKKAFNGVYLNAVPVYWQAGFAGVPVLALYAAYLQKAGIKAKEVTGSLDMDPLATWLKAGQMPTSPERAADELAACLAWSKKNAPQLAVLGVQGTVYADAGANAVQELAYVLAATAEYLRLLTQRGAKPQEILERTRWVFSIGSHFFTEASKFRAARLLWANLLKAYGLEAAKVPARLHGRTGLYNKTVFDPHVNMLRGSMEAFAAVVGGVESLHVAPYDEVLREPDAMSRRVARNAQIILREECGLDRLIDPAGGSYYVEWLTNELASKAWDKFQCIEKAGGYRKAIESGELQKAVAVTAADRAKRLSQRRDVLVGTNQFAVVKEAPQRGVSTDYAAVQQARAKVVAASRTGSNAQKNEKILHQLADLLSKKQPNLAALESAIKAAAEGATLGEIAKTLRTGSNFSAEITKLPYGRLAMAYEQLRAKARHVGAKVFLATMGPLKQHKARADFIQSFVEAGGVEAIYQAGFNTPEEATQAALASGARVVVLCSTDDTYPTLVPAVAQAIKAASPSTKVYLAGFPGEQEAAYKAAGMDDYIFVKSNHLDSLTKIVNLYA